MNAYRLGLLNRICFRNLGRRLCRIEVVGAEQIRLSGGAILAANHPIGMAVGEPIAVPVTRLTVAAKR